MTYDAVMGVAGSAYASIALTGVTNVITGTTKSYLKDSTVSNGNVSLDAKEELNLNGLLFAVTGSGVGASISGIANVNTVANNVYSKIENSQIQIQALFQ
jgi:hypothetical protein